MKARIVLGLGPLLLCAIACGSAGGSSGGFNDAGVGGATGGVGGATGGFGGATGGVGGATGGFGGATGGAAGAAGGFGGATGGFGGGTGATGGGGTGGGGATCDEASDCASPTTMVCDPATAKCVAGQCSDTIDCQSGKTCVAQDENASVGACYPECIFKGTPCAGGATCKVSMADNSGFCWGAGSASEGQSCKATALNTGCATGLVCATDQSVSVCRNQCSFWSGSPGCPSSQRCALIGVCFAESGDPAALDGTCASGSTGGEPCGNDGAAWRGLCANTSGTTYTCLKACRAAVSADCPSGKTCQVASGQDVGVCN